MKLLGMKEMRQGTEASAMKEQISWVQESGRKIM